MKTYKPLISLLFILTVLTAAQAQRNSTIQWFYSACTENIVVDLSGTMDPGYDIYYQAFDLFGGLGEPLTGLRRVSVNGNYALSQVINWNGRETRAAGSPVSIVFRMARENDPDATIFEEPSDDYVLAECHEAGSTLDEGAITSDSNMIDSSGVFTPDGGMLNPIYAQPPEPVVQIGARRTETEHPGRTANPGLIFAECAGIPGADPGILFDTDPITIFWSWYARTPQQIQDHITNAQYTATLNGQPLPEPALSPIKQVSNSRDWWVFYTVNLGDKWQPGGYNIHLAVSWANPVYDGYEDFGPDTKNVRLDSGCYFAIQRNPWGIPVVHEQPSYPLQSYSGSGG